MGRKYHISRNGPFKVLLQIPISSEGVQKQTIVKGTGLTILKAVEDITTNMESSVDLLHIRIIIFDRKLVEEGGMVEPINTFMRIREISSKTVIAICDDNIDAFFLTLKKNLEKGINLYEFFEKYAGWTPQISLTRLWHVYRALNSYTQNVAIPMVRSGENTPVTYAGSAVMNKGKMVSKMDAKETLLFNAFHGNSMKGRVEVMEHATIMIVGNTDFHKGELRNHIPYMFSTIRLDVVIQERRGKVSNAIIKKELEKVLANRFDEMLKRFQKQETDVFGLGQHYRNKIPYEELKDWRKKYYPNLEMKLTIHTTIQNEGNIKTIIDK
ncbi:Ger(x)C family spore germination protein [Peribacillus frigoritolerans]|uniref:Ger(x)C family spore germination protein n=1 Tax=Peribacillus frigoritolerans TaxID=450367 RepID=UPI000BED0099|nr:Ger(x)C family spore germination protein [Peribacillus frigoritolerans]MCR8871781.1 Ger(x)C family spore germination protein [Peribacillus frigoritolerans]PEF38394.1 spore gernimation protein GerC [Bacillus sp. AFS094228]